MTELTSVRRSLFDLEAKHGRVRQQFEEEVTRMRAELDAIRQQSNPNLSVGIPGLRSSTQAKLSDASSSFSSLSDQQQSQQGRPFTRDRPSSALDRNSGVRVERDERDVSERGGDTERLADPRDPKRHKARRDFSGISFSPRPDLFYLL